jgi:hypothetical protein
MSLEKVVAGQAAALIASGGTPGVFALDGDLEGGIGFAANYLHRVTFAAQHTDVGRASPGSAQTLEDQRSKKDTRGVPASGS